MPRDDGDNWAGVRGPLLITLLALLLGGGGSLLWLVRVGQVQAERQRAAEAYYEAEAARQQAAQQLQAERQRAQQQPGEGR
jgi:hypothetical protein